MRFSGALRGTSVFTMEPEGALAWSRSVGDATGAQLITTFIAVVADVVSDLVRASAQAMHGDAVDFDRASLCENSRVAVVIGTHAPGDTAIVTLGFDVEFGGAVYPAQLDLLLEPKLLTGYGDLLDAAAR
jgi:hypothetical protein